MSDELRFTPTAEQLVDAYQLHHRRFGKNRIMGFLLFALLLGVSVAAIEDHQSLANSSIIVGVVMLWAVLVLAIFYLVVGRLWLPRFARRVFRQQNDLHSEVTISWDDRAYTTTAPSGHASCAWSDYYAWRRNDKTLLLYRSESLFNYLPMNDASFRAAADSMVAYLRAAGIRERL
jgi:hypothetical protein